MKLIFLFFTVFIVEYAVGASKPDYPLPVSKVNLAFCHAKVAALHTGLLDKQWLFNDNAHFFIQYETQDSDNKVWLTLCNLDNGVILKDDTINSRAP